MPGPNPMSANAIGPVGASLDLLGNVGLGADVSQQLKDNLEDKRKKLLAGADGTPGQYGADLSGAVGALFGTMK